MVPVQTEKFVQLLLMHICEIKVLHVLCENFRRLESKVEDHGFIGDCFDPVRKKSYM